MPPEAFRTDSGLAYKVLEPGTGTARPRPSDNVRISYSAWTARGVMFKSNDGGRPSTVPVSGLIAGWSAGVRNMVEGERTRLWIPEELAYAGQSGQPRGRHRRRCSSRHHPAGRSTGAPAGSSANAPVIYLPNSLEIRNLARWA